MHKWNELPRIYIIKFKTNYVNNVIQKLDKSNETFQIVKRKCLTIIGGKFIIISIYGIRKEQPMNTTVGERLKQLVKEKGLEQQEVAAQLNIKSPTFNGYVGNKREPSITKLKQLAHYFNVSVDYLIGHNDIRNPYLSHLSEEINAFIHNPENQTYIELAKEIKEKTLGKKAL